MNKSPQTEEPTNAKPSRDIKLTLLTSAISATLRLVIPVMGLFLAGLMIDALLGQVAMWAIVGAVAGFLIAAYLIFRQIQKLKKVEAARLAAEEALKVESEKAETAAKSSAKSSAKTSGKTSSKTSVKKSSKSSAKSAKSSPAKTTTKKKSPRKSSEEKSA